MTTASAYFQFEWQSVPVNGSNFEFISFYRKSFSENLLRIPSYDDVSSLDENCLEVRGPQPGGLVQFTATHSSQPRINIKAVKPGKKSSVAAFFGCNPRNDSIAQSEAPIDVFSLARENQENNTTVTVNHRLTRKDESGVSLPTQVTISMANERLGQMSEVVFSIQEGSFYNCVMPGRTDMTDRILSLLKGLKNI